GITNAEISAAAAIVDTKLATIAAAGKVANSATTATNLNTASAIVARDINGSFTAGTITAALAGNATTATTSSMASNMAGGAAGNIVYQAATNTSAMLPAGSANYLLQGNGAGFAPTWTNAPTISGANITVIPAAAIAAGNLGPNVVASSIAVNAVYPGAVTAGTYGVSITGNAGTADGLNGGIANQIPYQAAANNTAFLPAPGAKMVLYGDNGAPPWTNTPAFAGTNVTAIPWANVLKTVSSLADLATRSAADLTSGTLPLARLSGITNAEIAAAAGIVDSKLATIAAAGKVSNSATTAASINTASAIVARDGAGNFTAGTITAALIGNVTGDVSGSAGSVPWTSVTSKPLWMQATLLTGTMASANKSMPSGFYEANGGTNYPTAGTWYNLINSRHQSASDDHGFQIAASYYDENVWTRTYQGGTGNNDGAYSPWKKLVREEAGPWAIGISGNAATATRASNLNGGAANQVVYQSAAGATAFVGAPGSNVVLYGNNGAPQWTNAPTLTATYVTGLPWSGVLKAGSSLADLEIRSAADLNAGILPLARLSGITNAEISASAAIADTKLDTIATAGKVSNSATTAASATTASAIVARDASGNFAAGTITAALTGAASLNVLKAGDTMTGALNFSGVASDITSATDEHIAIMPAGTGNVGIGTGLPLQKLQVAGDINIEAGSGVRINNTAVTGNYLRGDGTRFVSSPLKAEDIGGAIGGTPALTLAAVNAAGTANTFVRTDATLLAFDAAAPEALGTAAAGAAGVAARRDHVHPAADLAGAATTGILPLGKGGTSKALTAAGGG
ncbi:MAG: hypothetical protein NTY45_04995, partial [Elusimicrobia bacterium]|nr:hypothetical protein [Elusimicrobiota bacterium]